jgi:hypothetical protein
MQQVILHFILLFTVSGFKRNKYIFGVIGYQSHIVVKIKQEVKVKRISKYSIIHPTSAICVEENGVLIRRAVFTASLLPHDLLTILQTP